MYFRVKDGALEPMTKEAHEAMQKFANGDELEIEILKPIYSRFNAKMFAAFGLLAKATGVTVKAVQARLLISTGRFDNVQLAPHKIIQVPHSMSRNAMSQREREEFWDDLREVANTHILPFIDPHLAEEIRNIFGEQQQESAA